MSSRLKFFKQQLIRECDQAQLDLVVAKDHVVTLTKEVEDLTRDIKALEALGYV